MANEPKSGETPAEPQTPPQAGAAPAATPAPPPVKEAPIQAPHTVINFGNPLGTNGSAPTAPAAEAPPQRQGTPAPARAAQRAAEAITDEAGEAGEWVERTVLEVPPWVTVATLATILGAAVLFIMWQRSRELQRQATAPPEEQPIPDRGVVNLEKPAFFQD
jgi:hypothetical protein